MAKMTGKQMKAYNMFEKTEPTKVKKAEMKKPESKSEKARETKVGMKMMMKKAAPMKKMGKKK